MGGHGETMGEGSGKPLSGVSAGALVCVQVIRSDPDPGGGSGMLRTRSNWLGKMELDSLGS